jgi:hypothetical protein
MSRFLRNRRRLGLPFHRFPTCLAGWHSREGSSISGWAPHPPSCAPFAPSPLRDFLATTGALTPAGPSPTTGQVSLIHVSDLPIPPSPTTPQALDADFVRYPSSRRVSRLRRSRLHLFPAGSPTLTGRIEFVILRMDRSPPVAPHPASRRRSYSWLQAGERIPEEGFHLSDQTRFQAHWEPLSSAAISCARTKQPIAARRAAPTFSSNLVSQRARRNSSGTLVRRTR